MPRFLSLLFVPQSGNNHRALLLKPGFLGILIALYLLNQSLLRSFALLKPGVLGYSSEITISKVLTQTNQERTQKNLPPLEYSQILSDSAAAKARDIFAQNYWSHNSPSGKSPWDFFREANYQYKYAGENLAKDFYDTESLLKAWMNSPTHRDNIVNTHYQQIGIAVVNGVLDGIETTLVVQHFGTPLNPSLAPASAPPADALASSPTLLGAEVKSVAKVSPLFIGQLFGSLIFLLIMSVLIIDSYITLKNNTPRLTGSTATHLAFLFIIMALLLFSQKGTIF